MNLTRFLKGLAPALAVAALIGFSAPAPSFADDATPTPAASAPAAAAPAAAAAAAPAAAGRRRRQAAAAGDARLRRRRRGDRRHRQICGRPGRPRRYDELHAVGRRHRLDADLRRPRADDDHPGPRPLLRRHGPQEERRRHRDDELRHHLPGDGPLRGLHLQPVVHFGRRLHRRAQSRVPAKHSQRREQRRHRQPQFAGADDP